MNERWSAGGCGDRKRRRTLIGELVSEKVACVEVFGERRVALFPEEEMSLGGGGPKRRREFITGRYCARTALTHLGVEPTPLPNDSRRGPRWPKAIVGSITHCAEFRAAVVARASHTAGLGIDAEPNRPLPSGVLDLVARPAETTMLEELDPTAPVCWDRLLFSAKEAVYKVWHPLMRCPLAFADAVVTFSATERVFDVHLSAPLRWNASAAPTVHGRWGVTEGVIGTAIELSRT